MVSEASEYLKAAVREYMKEAGVKHLAWVPSPSIDDRFDEESSKKGKFADTALSHLMKLLYIARLCRGDFITTVTFLARRVHFWSLNEDRRLRRLMQYIHHHDGLGLKHQLCVKDSQGAFLDFSPDAELGGDPYTTFASGGF